MYGQSNSMQLAINRQTQLLDLPLELLAHLVTFAHCPCDVINAGRTCRTLRVVADTFLAERVARVHPVPTRTLPSLPTRSVRLIKSLTELEQQLIVRCAGRVITCNIHNPGDPRKEDLVSRTKSDGGLAASPAVMHCFPDWSSVRALVIDFRLAKDWAPLRTKNGRLATGIESLESLGLLSNVTHLTVYSTEAYLDSVLALIHQLSGRLQHLNFRDGSIGEIDFSNYRFPWLRSFYLNLLGVVELPKSLPSLVTFDCSALHAETILARLVRYAPRIAAVRLREPFGFDRPSVGFDHPASTGDFSSDSDSTDMSDEENSDSDSGDMSMPSALSQRVWSAINLPSSLCHLSLPETVRLSKLACSPHVTHLEISGHNHLTRATGTRFPSLVSLSIPELTFIAIKALQQSPFAVTLTHLTIQDAMFDLIGTDPTPVLRLPNLVHVHADQELFLSTDLDAPNLISTIVDLQGARDPHPTILARILSRYPRLARVKLEWFGAWASEKAPQLTFMLPRREQQELGLAACPSASALACKITHLDIPAGFTYLIPDCRGLRELIVRVPSLNPRLDVQKWADAIVGGASYPYLTAMSLIMAKATDDHTPIQVNPNSILAITLSTACPRLVSFSVQGSLDIASQPTTASSSKSPISVAWNGALGNWQWSAIIDRLAAAPGWDSAVQHRAARNGVRVRVVGDPGRVNALAMLDGLAKLAGHRFREKLSVVQRKGVGRFTFEIVGHGGETSVGGLSLVLDRLKRYHYPTNMVNL
ncbi:hypothetical protein BCR44DRAFT_23605 [Catenaria anguillulae PL171]|uniref:F-box domain-containing protein n=1 Tax=Catenaria anguillulae PL171 TaxID=765915 RepID=A0A1Y2HNG3_9FUNG|nr:hypothetical protein BCR44DRAFT_23605 [Catenaria anguillulae PL171]